MTGLIATATAGFSRDGPSFWRFLPLLTSGWRGARARLEAQSRRHCPARRHRHDDFRRISPPPMSFPGSTGRPFFAVRIFCHLGATPAIGILRSGGRRHFGAARTSRAVSARVDGGDRRPFRISQSRHRLLRFHAHRRHRAVAPAAQPHPVSDCPGDFASNIGAAATLIGNPQDMMIGQVAHLSFGRYLLWSAVPVILAMAAAYGIIWLLSRKKLFHPTARSGMNPADLSVQPDAHDQGTDHSRRGHRPVFLVAAQGSHCAGRRRNSSGQHPVSHRRFAAVWWNGPFWFCSWDCLW
jgi:hypothetical protein